MNLCMYIQGLFQISIDYKCLFGITRPPGQVRNSPPGMYQRDS